MGRAKLRVVMLRSSLVWAVLFVGATAFVNVAIYGWLGVDARAQEIEPSFAPAGYMIGVVWTLLFAMMGVAYGSLRAQRDFRMSGWVLGFALLCLAYPLYTDNFNNRYWAQAGSIVSLGYAWILCARLWGRRPLAAWMLLPSCLWLSFATFLLTAIVALNGWIAGGA